MSNVFVFPLKHTRKYNNKLKLFVQAIKTDEEYKTVLSIPKQYVFGSRA